MPVDPGSMQESEKLAIKVLDVILKFNPGKGHKSHFLTCPVKPINRYNKLCSFIKKRSKKS
jgi:hypothetical protein